MEVTRLDESYYRLIKRLPLAPIGDHLQLKKAHAIVQELVLKGEERRSGESAYLAVLARLVADYESIEFAHLRGEMTQGEILQSLLESSGMSQNQLGKLLGISQARLSDVINGRRALSKEQIVKLCRRFKLSANLFLFASDQATA
jgi:antitoxin component HigA of HigAB toxin-antitoxin module